MGHVSTLAGARRFAQRIYSVTGGNPFYTIELLKTMFAQGLLVVHEESGDWMVSPAALAAGAREFAVSQTVHDVIAERVERLPEPLRQVLVTAAVASGGCSAELLSQVHSLPRLHVAALADALVERRLFVEGGGSYRCAHPVVGRVVRDRLTGARRQEIHRTLALVMEALTPAHEARGLAGEIARHADHGGERASAYRWARVACESAIERYAYREALSWLELAGGNASGEDEANEVKRVTGLVLEAAGLGEAPAVARLGGPITRGLEREDFDLPVEQ
jgi:predicted ATPase